MATLCKTFLSNASALQAAAALSAAAVPARDIGVLIGHRYHGVRTEPVGGFDGPIGAAAPLGKYAGPPRMRWRAAGGFAPHPQDRRRGSFGDVDCILSVRRQDGEQHVEANDDDHAQRLLTGAQLPDEVARRMVRHLHEGQSIMFVQLTQVDLRTAQALIGHSTVAA
jgi:hypothetical protein